MNEDLNLILEEFNIHQVNSERNYWLIRTQTGEYFDEYYFEKFVAIGWNEISISDINSLSPDELKTKIEDKYPEEKQPGLICNQLIRFVKEIKKDDIVIIPSSGSKYIAFGKISSDEIIEQDVSIESDEMEEKCQYSKRRKVTWLKTVTRDDLDIYLYKLIYSHHSITNANDYASYIERTLNNIYFQDDKLHIIFNVKRTSDITLESFNMFTSSLIHSIKLFNRETGSDISIDDMKIKATVNSPGPIEIIINPVGAVVILGFLVMIVGGKITFKHTKDETTGEISTNGIIGQFLSFFAKRDSEQHELDLIKLNMQKSMEELEISPPIALPPPSSSNITENSSEE